MARLLLIDDDPSLLEVLTLAFEDAGHTVTTALDGAAGLRAVGAGDIELLISDVNMPLVDGFTLCRKLRQNGNDVPFILLTSRDSDIDEALGLDVGADDYVSKPFSTRALLSRVTALLRRSERRRCSGAIEPTLASLRPNPPDLIVLTGDVADKLEELEAALALVTAFAPRLGVYAALGNHEYLNGIQEMRPAYQRSSVRLLVNQTASLSVGDATLFLAGVDDPVFIGPARAFFERVVAECAVGAPARAFRLLLCHRPDGFEPAAEHGFHLTLSGHTHGGQLGILGRSAFEVLFGMPYLWGSYRRGESRLYTTSGFGHWFPFRLNCPAEAPLITLRRG